MPDYKDFLGILTLVIGLISYSLYFRAIFSGKVKPDPYSWLIWGALAGITFFAQVSKGGGAGTWATALTAIICIVIAAVAFYRGDGHAKLIDWVSIGGALIGLILWDYTRNPLAAVELVIIIGALGFVPIFRQAFYKPQEEPTVTFALNGLKFGIALFAMGSLDPVTWLYPAAMTVMNGSLVTILILRKR